MLNFIRGDLWKLFRTRSFYITLVILLAVMFIFGLLIESTTRIDYDTYLQMQEKQTGVKVTTSEKVRSEEEYNKYQEKIRASMNSPFFIGIVTSESGVLYLGFAAFISLFALLDYNRGYMKNIITIPNAKTRWFISKLVVAAVTAAIYILAIVLAASLYGILKTGATGFTLEQVLPFMAGQFAALMALAATQLLFVVFFQQTLPTLFIGLLIARNLHSILFNLIDNVNFLPFSAQTNSFWAKVYKLTISSTGQVSNIVIHGAILLVFLTALSLLYSRRKDIKC